MYFSTFAVYLSELEQRAARLEMTKVLSEVFRTLEPDEIQQASYLLLGGLTPQYLSLEFQLSTKMVLRALARLKADVAQESMAASQTLFGELDFSSSETEVTKQYKMIGDLGVVAESIARDAQLQQAGDLSEKLSILEVFAQLCEIAREAGAGSQDRKVRSLVALLSALDPLSVRYVVRIVIGKMRLGFSTMTLLDALSWAVVGDKSDSAALELAYQKKADIGALATTYLYGDRELRQERLASYSVAVGIPVVPALCQRLNSAHEIIEKMTEVLAEPKYDGLRVQIHVKKGADGLLRTYTRNLEETTHMFPELLTALDELKCDSCILDGEAIGYDRQTGQLQTFQMTVTRKRKHEIASAAAAVPMRFYIFDVLELNGTVLLDHPLRERKELLKGVFRDSEVLVHAPFIITSDPEVLRSFHVAALAEGLEGAVMKKTNSVYQSGRKGWSWVKIKEEEGMSGKLSDTLDLVVMGYYVGRGKRASFGLGAFLVGALAEDDTVVTIAKIGTGLTDEQFRELKQRADALATTVQPEQYVVPKDLLPDAWLKPELVVEIAADELTNSPLHSAGVALRFPRLVKFRDDKTWEQATTTTELQTVTMGKKVIV
jgi:DNA ligase-1